MVNTQASIQHKQITQNKHGKNKRKINNKQVALADFKQNLRNIN